MCMGGKLTEWEWMCVCVSDGIRLPMINPLPLCWAGEFCRFITAGPAGPERITRGREENDHSLSNTGELPRFLLQLSTHTDTHTFTHLQLFHLLLSAAFSFMITLHPPSLFGNSSTCTFLVSCFRLPCTSWIRCLRFPGNFSTQFKTRGQHNTAICAHCQTFQTQHGKFKGADSARAGLKKVN